MAIRMLPVQTATTVVVIDLAFALGMRICPEVEFPLLYAAPDLVEFIFGHEESVVDTRYLGVSAEIHEVNAHTVAHLDDLERTELGRLGETKNLGQEPGTGRGVA